MKTIVIVILITFISTIIDMRLRWKLEEKESKKANYNCASCKAWTCSGQECIRLRKKGE